MIVNSKGQVTIPKAIRERNGIAPGCEVEFVEEKGRLYLHKLETGGRGWDLVRRMKGKGSVDMTTDQIIALTRGED